MSASAPDGGRAPSGADHECGDGGALLTDSAQTPPVWLFHDHSWGAAQVPDPGAHFFPMGRRSARLCGNGSGRALRNPCRRRFPVHPDHDGYRHGLDGMSPAPAQERRRRGGGTGAGIVNLPYSVDEISPLNAYLKAKQRQIAKVNMG
jgi:hypothetical protein